MGEGRARYAVRRALVAGGLGAVVLAVVVFTRGSDTPSAQPPPAPTGAHSTTTATTVPTLAPSAPTPLGLDPSTPECLAANTTALSAEGIRAENAQPGTTAWRSALAPGATPVNVYLDRSSVQCSGTVAISLRGTGAPAIIRVFRLGWYAGNGGREMWRSGPVLARPAAVPPPSGPTRTVVLSWPVVAHLQIPPTWTPGLYVVTAAPADAPSQMSLAPLVVRADGVPTPLLVMDSDLTWAAYNSFGGSDLYRGIADGEKGTVAGRSYEVMLARPLVRSGLIQFVVRDAAVAALIESNGLSVGYTTDTAVDTNPGLLRTHHGLVVPGHSEYWTRRMLDGVSSARDAGVNLAVLGANTCYWQARITRDATGLPRSVTVYRQLALDPLGRARPADATTLWGAGPLNRDTVLLTGARFSGVGVSGPERVMAAHSWLLAGTGLSDGQILPAVAGNEVDSAIPAPGVTLQGVAPQVDVLLEGVYRPAQSKRSPTMTVSYFAAASGAGIFNAGTTEWVCKALNSCLDGSTPRVTSTALRQITITVLKAFSEPRAGLTHPQVGSPGLSDTALAAVLGPANLGVQRGSGD
ncbi:MAG: N,N-dimethylformamidase beta subunit family domain-containing protein [Candidatus Lutibacillus vidarii]